MATITLLVLGRDLLTLSFLNITPQVDCSQLLTPDALSIQ